MPTKEAEDDAKNQVQDHMKDLEAQLWALSFITEFLLANLMIKFSQENKDMLKGLILDAAGKSDGLHPLTGSEGLDSDDIRRRAYARVSDMLERATQKSAQASEAS